VRPRLGLAFALAVPLLPLGNVSVALALVYAVLAVAWLTLFAREPQGGLLPAAGPLLGAVGALGLAPLGALALRSPLRRAAAASASVLLAVTVARIRGAPLPLTEASPPRDLHLAGSESATAVSSVLVEALVAHPALLVTAAALGAAAALLPYCSRRGPWGLAAWGSATLAATLLGAPQIAAAPLVLAVWATCAVGATRSWT
jgi:hypothetical protein